MPCLSFLLCNHIFPPMTLKTDAFVHRGAEVHCADCQQARPPERAAAMYPAGARASGETWAVCGTALPAELGGRRSGLNGLRLCGQDFTGQSQVWQGSYNRKLWPFESTKLIVSLSWPNCTPGLYCNLGDEIINTQRVCQEQLRSWLQGRQAKSPTPRIREMLGSQLKILGPWPPF